MIIGIIKGELIQPLKELNLVEEQEYFPEKKLDPSIVYKAGFVCMIIGLTIGGYFIFQSGLLIAIILGIATLSIYFYSTTIVNIGLGETLVAVKGTMIVIG